MWIRSGLLQRWESVNKPLVELSSTSLEAGPSHVPHRATICVHVVRFERTATLYMRGAEKELRMGGPRSGAKHLTPENPSPSVRISAVLTKRLTRFEIQRYCNNPKSVRLYLILAIKLVSIVKKMLYQHQK